MQVIVMFAMERLVVKGVSDLSSSLIFLSPLDPFGSDREDETKRALRLFRERVNPGQRMAGLSDKTIQTIERLRDIRNRTGIELGKVCAETGVRMSFLHLIFSHAISDEELESHKEAWERVKTVFQHAAFSPNPA